MRLDDIRSRRAELAKIAARHGASNLRVFGSVARGEDGPGSDVDLLVDLEPGRSLLDIGSLIADLQEVLGGSVDVAEPGALHALIRDRVIAEAVPL